MSDPFDILAPNLEAKLREDCFRVVSMIAMVAEDPVKNAHFINECHTLLEKIHSYLSEAGLEGDGETPVVSKQLDVVDLLFLKTAEGIKRYFQNALDDPGEDDDDD
jgi:hypothetical protein